MPSGPILPESDLDSTDPYARGARTFPRVSHEMAARVAPYGTEERLPAGTPLVERGLRSVDVPLGKPNPFAVRLRLQQERALGAAAAEA